MRHLRVGLAVEEVVLLAVLYDLAAFDFIAIGIEELAALLGALLLLEEILRQLDLGIELVVVADTDLLRCLLLLFLSRQCSLLFADVRLVVLRGVGRDRIAVGAVVAGDRIGVCRSRASFRSIRTRHCRSRRLCLFDGLLVCENLALVRIGFHIRIQSLARCLRQCFHCCLRRFFCGLGSSERVLRGSHIQGCAIIRRLARCDGIQSIDLILRLCDFFHIGFLDLW